MAQAILLGTQMTRDTDALIIKEVHDAVKVARSIVDEGTRATMIAKITEIDRLYSIRLTQAHEERVMRDEVEKVLKK